MLNTHYRVEGMSCQSCIGKVTKALNTLSSVQHAEVTLRPPQAEITMLEEIPLNQLNSVLQKAGNYRLTPTLPTDNPAILAEEETLFFKTYKPLILLSCYLILFSLLFAVSGGEFNFQLFMRSFMAGFFIMFSFFKMLDLKGFASSYATYDLLAKQWYGYGFIYPFIELSLGISYFLNIAPQLINLITIIIMSFGTIGVAKVVLDKKAIRCACLGTVFNLPMSRVTIIENVTMILMAVMMLLR